LARDIIHNWGRKLWELDFVRATAGDHPAATVCLVHGEKKYEEAAVGDGPIEAAVNAIKKITGAKVELVSLQIENVTGGIGAQGEAAVVLESEGRQCKGSGTDTDIVVAAVEASLDALNRLLLGESNGCK
jgi:2-isopropylmalate synthase